MIGPLQLVVQPLDRLLQFLVLARQVVAVRAGLEGDHHAPDARRGLREVVVQASDRLPQFLVLAPQVARRLRFARLGVR